ncbi:MAG: hypothetical protein NZM18_08900 [Thermoflexales bacterium]|nr:hypothetical protein [Thermoflexales bacterium]
MAFTVRDFDDLIRLLDERPEWRDALRRRVFTDELIELPRVTRELADAQIQIRRDLDVLAQRLDQLTQRVDQLAQRLDQLTQRVDQLAQKLDELIEAQLRSEQRLQRLEGDTAWLKGMMLEIRYAERPYVYFKDLIRRARALEGDELHDLLERIGLTDQELRDVVESDVVAVGRMRESDAEAYLVAEVSWGIGPDDVERAARRAALLSRSGRRVIPVVAGDWITPQALDAAAERRVWYVLGGCAIEPK